MYRKENSLLADSYKVLSENTLLYANLVIFLLQTLESSIDEKLVLFSFSVEV